MRNLITYKFTALSAAVILVALMLPSSSLPSVPSIIGIDKIAHLALFFLFSFAFSLEAKKEKGRLSGLVPRMLIILVFIFGSEALQLLEPTRHFEFADMAFDALGAALALLAARLFARG